MIDKDILSEIVRDLDLLLIYAEDKIDYDAISIINAIDDLLIKYSIAKNKGA